MKREVEALAKICDPRNRPALSYTDYIADRVRAALATAMVHDAEAILKDIGRIEWDLHPTGGYYLSSRKMLTVTDRNGRQYRITIEDPTEKRPEIDHSVEAC